MKSTLPRFLALLFCLCAASISAPDAMAFFCNQPTVSIEWCGESTFKIDGDGFSRGNFTLVNPGAEGMLEFSQTEFSDALDATFNIKGVRPGTTKIEVAWEFTDESDNGICEAEVTVGDYTIGYDAAVDVVAAYLQDRGISSSDAWAFMPKEPLTAGMTISSGDPEANMEEWAMVGDEAQVEYVADLNGFSLKSQAAWFGWVDYNKDDRFGGKGEMVFVDAKSGDVEQYNLDFWPVLDGAPYLTTRTERINSEDRVFGDDPAPSTTTDDNSITSESEPGPVKEDVCAVLVSGHADKPRQTEAFEGDVEFIRQNLMNESKGERINPENIAVLNNASREQITSTLEGFAGTYRKVYFFYSGHGSENYLVTNDEVGSRLWYADLVRALDNSQADEVCVIIDACHSGGAVEVFERAENLKDQNVTLVTSCSKDTSSWTRYIPLSSGDTVRTGEYTWAFVQCYGAPAADRNGDDVVNVREAHLWAVNQNPTLDVGGTLVGRMNPQEYHHRAVRPAREPVTRVPDSRVTIETGESSGLNEDDELQFDVKFDLDDPGTFDETVLRISPLVIYEAKWTIEPDDYKFNMRIDYRYMTNDFTGEGIPGVVWRPDDGQNWSKWEMQENDEEDSNAVAIDISKLGQFGIGEVKPDDPNSVAERAAALGFVFNSIAPNPAQSDVNISWSLQHPGDVRLTIVDLNGREVFNTPDRFFAAGEHLERIALPPALTQGNYYLRVRYKKAGEFPVALTQAFTLVRP